ncbi:MltA domain-containing protein [Vibrio chagasii]|nr:MltA domain-containing protein [Vibrio chagasii]
MALEGQGLELGYAANRIDPFMMEVQGSGFVHFGDDDAPCILLTQEKQPAYINYWSCVDRARLGSPREDVIESLIKEWVLANDPEVVKELLEQKPIFRFL